MAGCGGGYGNSVLLATAFLAGPLEEKARVMTTFFDPLALSASVPAAFWGPLHTIVEHALNP